VPSLSFPALVLAMSEGSGRLFNPDEFACRVRVEIARRHIDMRRAAVQIGCSHATVSRIANGKSPDVENYLKIMRWLSRTTRKDDRRG
jgi:transcriptional regulator with XRE-family HTH domain